DTVCRPTKDRQKALEQLLEKVDAVVIVGGRNSNNTRALLALCCESETRAWHVERAEDLDERWFQGLSVIGLTAGTSTLDETVDDVQERLEAIETSIDASLQSELHQALFS